MTGLYAAFTSVEPTSLTSQELQMRRKSLVPTVSSLFDEEIGKLTVLFQRHDPVDYEEYKRIRCRMQFLVEFCAKSEGLRREVALHWILQNHNLNHNQRDLEELFRSDPFDLKGKEIISREQILFFFQSRACAR
jgi:hypothetical protein